MAGFVKTVPKPVRAEDIQFLKPQEDVRMDVERSCRALQAIFRILDTPCKLWNNEDMRCIVIACIILHNMVVGNERYFH